MPSERPAPVDASSPAPVDEAGVRPAEGSSSLAPVDEASGAGQAEGSSSAAVPEAGLPAGQEAPEAPAAALQAPAVRPKASFAGRLGASARRAGVALDAGVSRLGFSALSWVGEIVLQGIALGAGVYWLTHPEKLAAVETNKLPEPERITGTIHAAAALLALLLVHLAAALVTRLRRGSWRFVETSSRLNRLLGFVLALPFVAALRLTAIEKNKEIFTLFLVASAAFLLGRFVYRLAPGGAGAAAVPLGAAEGRGLTARLDRMTRLGRFAAPLGVALLAAGYGFFFSRLALFNHWALHTRTTDLGYYDNIFWQSIHGNFLGCSFIKAGYHGSAHFDPILILFSPLYLLHPNAEFLLVFQSVWLGTGVVPVYLLARDKLKGYAAPLALAACYAIYPAMHGANMYEFHSLTLAGPFLLWALYFFESGAYGRYYAALALCLLVREDIALVMCFVGAYAILTRRAGAARLGWITVAASLLYFAIVKKFFMTSSDIFMSGKDAYSFAYYYEGMIPNRTGMGGLVMTLVSNPVYTLRNALDEPKLVYLALLFLPLGFLPFFAKPGRFMLAYGLFFCLLASRTAVFSTHFQYSTVIYPIAFALVPAALLRLRDGRASSVGWDGRRLARAWLAGALVASILTSWKFGGIVDNASFKGGFLRVDRQVDAAQRETYAWITRTAGQIPKEARVGTTNRMGPHVSNRRHAYFYPERLDVDFVFIDESELRGGDLDRHRRLVKGKALVEEARRGKIALFRKVK